MSSRDELRKLSHARNISRLLARSAAALQVARSMKCPKGAETVLRQTMIDNSMLFRSMYSVLAYLYLSPSANTDGVLDSVVSQTADRTLMLGDVSVITQAMKLTTSERQITNEDLVGIGLLGPLGTDPSDGNPLEFVPVLDRPAQTGDAGAAQLQRPVDGQLAVLALGPDDLADQELAPAGTQHPLMCPLGQIDDTATTHIKPPAGASRKTHKEATIVS